MPPLTLYSLSGRHIHADTGTTQQACRLGLRDERLLRLRSFSSHSKGKNASLHNSRLIVNAALTSAHPSRAGASAREVPFGPDGGLAVNGQGAFRWRRDGPSVPGGDTGPAL